MSEPRTLEGSGPEDRGAVLRHAAAAAIGLLAMARTLVAMTGQRYFDLDPSLAPMPMAAIGPAGSQALDASMLLAAAIGVLGLQRGGRWPAGPLARWAWLLLVPAAIVLWWHGRGSMDDRWIGSSWIAAMAGAAVAFGLARDPGPRAVLLSVLLAAMVPVAARGLLQVRIGSWLGPEYAETLGQWMVQRSGFLADRGWDPDSPAARIFERRLLQPQPTGWFATTNIFATMAAASAVLAAGLAVAAARTRAGLGAVALPAVMAVAAAGLLAATGSKAAWAAMLLAALMLLGGRLAATGPAAARWLRLGGGWLGVLVVPVVLGFVVLRGALPEDFAGDRSLLFRWHYLQGAAGAIAESPLEGLGADGFRAAYLRHRPIRSPEEVLSPHSVTVDWLLAGGLAALGWIAALLAACRLLGRGMTREPEPDLGRHAAAGDAVLAAGVGLATVLGIAVESDRLDGIELLVRLVAAGLAAVVVVRLRRLFVERGPAIPGAWFAAAGLLAVAHAQVEMTATQPNAVAWWAVFVATMAAAACPTPPSPRASAARPVAAAGVVPAAFAALLVAAIAASAILLTGVRPAVRQAAVAADAAARIVAAAEVRMPVDADTRIAAAARLEDAAAITPAPRWVERQVARQLVRAVTDAEDPAARARALAAAAAWSDARPPFDDEPVLVLRERITVLELRWDAGDAEAGEEAIAAARAAWAADPHGAGSARRLAELLEQAGRREEAATVACEALVIDAAKELDPARQLAARDRERLERIAAGGD